MIGVDLKNLRVRVWILRWVFSQERFACGLCMSSGGEGGGIVDNYLWALGVSRWWLVFGSFVLRPRRRMRLSAMMVK